VRCWALTSEQNILDLLEDVYEELDVAMDSLATGRLWVLDMIDEVKKKGVGEE